MLLPAKWFALERVPQRLLCLEGIPQMWTPGHWFVLHLKGSSLTEKQRGHILLTQDNQSLQKGPAGAPVKRLV